MNKKFHVTGIIYDADAAGLVLPTSMTVECEDIDEVIDRVSDITGWLVESVDDIREVTEEPAQQRTYFQPTHYSDDGTNIEFGGLPEGLFSFQAFPSREACEGWLHEHGYDPGDFSIREYHDDEIEGVVLIDELGEAI